MIRSGSGEQPDGRRGRPGKPASGRKRRFRAAPPPAEKPQQRQPPPPTRRQAPPPPHRSMPPYYYDDEYPPPPRYAEHPPPQHTRGRPDPYYVDQRYETYGDVDPESYGPPQRTPRPAQQHLPPQQAPQPTQENAEARTQFVAGPGAPQPGQQMPKKLTVTRVAAMRSRQLTSQAYGAFRKAATADGAEKSGLTSLYYATMLNYASDAAMAVALANTLFFSAATGESKGKVALYLLITVAPFAFVAPIIGPALDRVQRGRRLAMCATSAGQALMCVVMAANFDTWLLYPAALGKMVLSKSYTVLKAAITPRVLPPDITLAKTNARLTVFGLAAGAVAGAVAAGLTKLFDSPGALWFTALICVVGAMQGLRIPSWVEVTEGEVPATLSEHPDKPRRQPMGRHIVVALWGNGTVRMLTGFLMLFAAFAVKAQTENQPVQQLLQLGLIGGAAGIGSFVGNAIGARIHVGHPDQVVIGCVAGSLIATVIATFLSGIGTAALVGLVGAIASALAKISLDAVIQDHLPEESRASAFGRSETVLQIGWVFGGAVGVLLPATYWVGFLVISILLAIGLLQTFLSTRGGTLIRGFGGDRPVSPTATGVFRMPKV